MGKVKPKKMKVFVGVSCTTSLNHLVVVRKLIVLSLKILLPRCVFLFQRFLFLLSYIFTFNIVIIFEFEQAQV